MVYILSIAQTDTFKYATVAGKIMFSEARGPAAGVTIFIPRLNMLTTTNDSGVFVFDNIKYGFYQLVTKSGHRDGDTLNISVRKKFLDLGVVAVLVKTNDSLPTPEIRPADLFDYGELQCMNSEDPYIPALTGHHGTYATATAHLYSLNFRRRGYTREQTEVYTNGLSMNNIKTGTPINTSGLSEAFSTSDVLPGLQMGNIGAGLLNGSVCLDWTAAHQEQHTIISYTHTNGNYRNRLLVAHHTGRLHNGWAFSVAATGSGSTEGYMDGTYNQRYAYYLGASRQVGKKSVFHFFTSTGKDVVSNTMAATQEAYDLAGSGFYNPSWGYQNGSMRSAHVAKTSMPLYAAQYEYDHNPDTHFELTFSYQYGYSEQSGLDWYNAADPRPDYYRKMPSYYINDPLIANENMAEMTKQKWLNDAALRQINWDQLYEVNRMNYAIVNGTTGYRSAYTLGSDREDIRKYMLAQSFRKKVSEHLKLAAGLNIALQQTENYRKMSDLLGGDYYVDLNPFAEQLYPGNTILKQTDLNYPDRIITAGDKYGYDYRSFFMKGFAWANLHYEHNRYDFFVSGKVCYDQFGRYGLYRNGLFPDSSYGKSATLSFLSYQFKTGFIRKINGFQNAYVNMLAMSRPPLMDDIFISPKTRNSIALQSSTEKTFAFEAGYLFHHQKWNGSIAVFASETKDMTEIRRFYYETDNTFVNYLMQHIGVRHQGLELALQMQILPKLTATATATWMQVFYSSNPTGTLYPDNDTTNVVKQHIAYLENYYIANGPQSAATLGFQYSVLHGFSAGINFNFTDRNYVAVNPMRHTEEAVDLLPTGGAQQIAVLQQEKLPSAFTLDLSVGKTFSLYKIMKRLPNHTSLRINAGVSNLLNRKDIRTNGYDQLRFDYDTKNPEIFPTKYTYGFGATYFVGCKVTF
jgi:hypothetical protein